MSDQELLELHKQHRVGQDKYTYFLLAVTASAIAFAVQKTDESIISWSLFPLGLAVVLWGISFYFGCKNLVWVQTSISANYGLLQLYKGVHPNQPDHPKMLEAAKVGIRSAVDSNINKAQFFAVWQFRLLLAGGFAFLCWHIIKMLIRTNAT